MPAGFRLDNNVLILVGIQHLTTTLATQKKKMANPILALALKL
jgi:hypothetical protein